METFVGHQGDGGIPDRVVRMELISFFNIHPLTVAGAAELAVHLGRSPAQVERQMEDLVALDILRKDECGGEVRYGRVPPVSGIFANRKAHAREGGDMGAGGACGAGIHRDEKRRRRGHDGEGVETGVRLRMIVTAMQRDGMSGCLELLLDVIHRAEGVPCAAYLLADRCSEIVWRCSRGCRGRDAGVMESRGMQNIVVEGELIRNKGFLETPYSIKYLHPLENGEDLLVCVDRNGSNHVDMEFLGSVFIDFLPVVAEKRTLDVMAERAAEKLFGDSVYWHAIHNPEVEGGMQGVLAALAKGIDAERMSLLVCDEDASLRTLATYGRRADASGRGRNFSGGECVAGWCLEQGSVVNLSNARIDPRFKPSAYDDIDSMLCCPLIPPSGDAIGVLCAVNKLDRGGGSKASFDGADVSLLQRAAASIAHALAARENRTKRLSRAQLRVVKGMRAV